MNILVKYDWTYLKIYTKYKDFYTYIKGTVMQIEKVLINDGRRVSKVFWKFRIPIIYNFVIIYPWNLLFS